MEEPILNIPLKGTFPSSGSFADVRIFASHYDIQFYFSGPDLRYNGDFAYIEGKRIDEYIESTKTNWLVLQKMKALNLEGTYTKKGKSDMILSVEDGKNLSLYVFSSYSIPIFKSSLHNEKEISTFITTLKDARTKAEAAMQLSNL